MFFHIKGRSQMQGGKNSILLKEINANRSSETLIGWKSGKTTFVPVWDEWRKRGYGLCRLGHSSSFVAVPKFSL
jgi:hypothetical protein